MCKAFKEGRQNVADMPQPGHLAVREEDMQTANASMLANQTAMIREQANVAGLAPSTVLNILKKWLGMRKIASRWIPYNLTENQKWL